MQKLKLLAFCLILTACIGNKSVNSEKNIENPNANQEVQKNDNNYVLLKPKGNGEIVKTLSNNIMVIFQDKNQNYWFGSWKDGLYKFDGKTLVHFSTKDGLPDNRIEEIKEDHLGNVYFNTSKGLCFWKNNQFLVFDEPLNNENEWALHPNDIWFRCLSDKAYVYRVESNRLYKLKIPSSKLGEEYIQKHPSNLSPYHLYSNYKDKHGNIWFGSSILGVFRYNGSKFDWISEPDVTELHNGPSNGVRSMVEDKNGDFWFNTAFRYKITENQPFYERIQSIGCLDGKKDGDLNEFNSIITDNQQNLWIAIYRHGVFKIESTSNKIQHFPIQIHATNVPVFCLYKDQKGEILLGTEENGLWKFNGKSFEKTFETL